MTESNDAANSRGDRLARRIAVVGGGVTGLAAAHRLLELSRERGWPLDVTLLEASERVGGVFGSRRVGEYLVETGADSFITNKPWGVNLCRRIGLESHLIPTDARYRRSLVLRNGKPVGVPEGFMLLAPAKVSSVMMSPLLSPWGKIRLGIERLIPRRTETGDESLGQFVTRRFGRETLDRLVQPLVGGIYTSDPWKLSLEATMPRFLEMEREHGSLIRALRVQAKQPNREHETNATGARYGLFVTLKDGMSELQDTLEQRVEAGAALRRKTAVRAVRLMNDGASLGSDTHWDVQLEEGRSERFDAVILAVRAPQAGVMLANLDAQLAEPLNAIEYASSAIVVTGHRESDIDHPMNAFGLVIPHQERRKILAVSFTSRKFPGRAPAGGKGGPAAPVTPSASPTGAPPRAGNPKGGADLDWDDDELETKLFDEAPNVAKAPERPVAAAEPDEPRGPAQPIAVAQPIAAQPIAAQPIAVAQPIATAQPIGAARPVATTRPPIGSAQPIAPTQPIAPSQPIAQAYDEEPIKRKLPIGLIAGIVGGLVLVIVLVVVLLGGDESKPGETPKTDEVAAAATGSITVQVKPQDATLTVDGKDQPGGTSRVVSNLAPGKHAIVVAKDDAYLPFEQEVEVAAGAPVILPVTLQLRDVTLTLDIEPAGAQVSLVEGETVTPIGKAGETYKLIRKPKTSYAIEAKLDGFQPSRAPITFTGEAAQSVKLVLVKDPSAKPPETPKDPVKDPVETPKDPKVDPGKKPATPKAPTQPKAKTATLKIGTGPGLPPAEVWVDGQKQDKTTPVVVQVAPGSHTIKWKWPDKKTATQKVSVGDKESLVVKGQP